MDTLHTLESLVRDALRTFPDLMDVPITFEHPADLLHGDFSTNVAMVYAKKIGKKPRDFAEYIVEKIQQRKPELLERVVIAGPGFVNFYLSSLYFKNTIGDILEKKETYGENSLRKGVRVLIEYTDPNPFKEFHIGHLMPNIIGESIGALLEATGAKVIRASYQGDIGPHVAKALWGYRALSGDSEVRWNGAYAHGATAYEKDPKVKEEIDILNKKLYEKSDPELMELYEEGKKRSLLAFEKMYVRLGTSFDHYFFESEVADDGISIVREFLKKGVFEESDGAVVFRGDKYGLHTRVFLTARGLPTYEAKELGLTKKKFDRENPDLSIVITANEQDEYFKVILQALKEIYPYIAEKTVHISHGMMRLSSGKMGSRTGNVIRAASLLDAIEKLVHEKISSNTFSATEKSEIKSLVAVGAVKYAILRQAIGGNIVYDAMKSISFEGDSGPYLQYTIIRMRSLLEKGKSEEILPSPLETKDISDVERLLVRFPEVVLKAGSELAPHRIVSYLIQLAGAFNSYYAAHRIVDKEDAFSSHRLALTQASEIVLTRGLRILAIPIPSKM
mgnify:CR=1 FL=1